MKSLLTLFFLSLAAASPAHARLGDTQDRAEARYGLPKPVSKSLARTPLIAGAKELTFHYEGWQIRCALLGATDGKEYIVRKEYTKIWNSEVMKRGGTSRIRDFERDAILKAEKSTGEWSRKVIGDLERDPMKTFQNQIGLLSGLSGVVWVRNDGAIARVPFGDTSVILDLPQARKYEAELKAINEQKARAAVPKF